MVPRGEHMLFVKVNEALRMFDSQKKFYLQISYIETLCMFLFDYHEQWLKTQGCYLRINQGALEHLGGYIHHRAQQTFFLCLSS